MQGLWESGMSLLWHIGIARRFFINCILIFSFHGVVASDAERLTVIFFVSLALYVSGPSSRARIHCQPLAQSFKKCIAGKINIHWCTTVHQIPNGLVAMISACHSHRQVAGDQGSIPC